jgi:hypothetical protein
LEEALGADAGPTGEKPLEVVLAETDAGSNLLEPGLLLIVVLKVQDGLLDAKVIVRELLIGSERGESIHKIILSPEVSRIL